MSGLHSTYIYGKPTIAYINKDLLLLCNQLYLYIYESSKN